jgi:hypothetical protein
MLFALCRSDNSVFEVRQCLPVRATDSDGRAWVVGYLDGDLLQLAADRRTMTVRHDVAHSAEWQADSVPGLTVAFDDLWDLVKSWPPAERDQIAAIRPCQSHHELPDPAFKAARVCGEDGRVAIDMPKARDIWRDRMRAARQPRLDYLDRLFNRAIGQRNETEAAAIEARRQALRDVPADLAIDAAETPAALKKVWPAILEQEGRAQ